jgi:hypothetical protein
MAVHLCLRHRRRQTLRRLFTVAEYDLMIQAGVFDEDDRLELIEGEVMEWSWRWTRS